MLYPVKVNDLIYSLSLVGGNYYEGDGRRIPDTDASAQTLNTLFVVVKGGNNPFTEQQRSLITGVVQALPERWNVATWGRSTMNVTIIPALTLSPASADFPHEGGGGGIGVTAPAGLGWTAASNADWITVAPPNGGTGNGSVNYTVAANTNTNPRSGTISVAGQTFTARQAAAPPQPPFLLSDEVSGRAATLDSVTFLRDPLAVANLFNLSQDRRTRLMLFAANADLLPGEDISALTAQAEDAAHKVYPLAVEFVGKVSGFGRLTQINVRLPNELTNAGEVLVSISLRGVASNKVLVSISPPQ